MSLKSKMIEANKRRITRRNLDRALATVHLSGDTLEIGAAGAQYPGLYERGVRLNIAPVDTDVQGDAHALPFADASFDNIVAIETLEHLRNPSGAIAEMTRVLRPGGRVLVTTRFCYPIHDPPHDYFRFTRFGLKELFVDYDVERLEETDSAAETWLILANRLAYDPAVRPAVRAIIFAKSWLAWPWVRLARNLVPAKSLTTGYLLLAKKRSP